MEPKHCDYNNEDEDARQCTSAYDCNDNNNNLSVVFCYPQKFK